MQWLQTDCFRFQFEGMAKIIKNVLYLLLAMDFEQNLVSGKIKIFREPSQDNFYELSSLMSDRFSQRQLQNIRRRVVLLQAYWIKDNRIVGSVPFSTGFLLQNGLILTAAHNIFMESKSLFATYVEVQFLPLQEASNKVGKEINKNQKIHKIKILLKDNNYRCELETNRQRKNIYKYDIALIYSGDTLKLPPEMNLQNHVKMMTEYQSQGDETNYVLGFPDLISEQSQAFKKHKKYSQDQLIQALLKQDVGKIKKTADNFIFYNIQTVSGQSGAPIFIKLKKRFYLIGVHTSYHLVTSTGRGVYFSSTITSLLQKWATQLQCPLHQQLKQSYFSDLPSYISLSRKVLNSQINKDKDSKIEQDSILNSSRYSDARSVLNSLCELQDRISDLSSKISDELSQNSKIKIGSMHVEISKLEQSLNALEIKMESSLSQKKRANSSLSFIDRKKLSMSRIAPQSLQLYSDVKGNEFSELKLKESSSMMDNLLLQMKVMMQTEKEQNLCIIHGERKLYYQLHYNDKLCFKCLRDEQHYSKEVLCPIHLQRIEFLDVKRTISQQKYMCSVCIQDYDYQNRIEMLRIDQTHKQVAEYILLDKDSINQNNFFRCEKCMKDPVNKFNAVKLDRHVIEQLFISSESFKYSPIIEESLSNLIQNLSLPYLQKLKDVFNDKGQKLISFVDILKKYIHHRKLDESYDILRYSQNPKMVKTEMQKLLFLRDELVDRKLPEIENIMIRIQLLVKEESQQMYKSIVTALKHYINKLEDIFPKNEKISLFSVRGKLKSDYNKVLNMTKPLDYHIRPYLLRNISPYLYGKIKHLEIVKDFQQQNEETAVFRRKEALKNTWVDIYRDFNMNKPYQTKKSNYDIEQKIETSFQLLKLSRIQFLKDTQIDDNIKELINFGMRCNLLYELNKQISKEDYHSIRLQSFSRDLIQPVIQRIMGLPNLKTLVLVYDHFLCCYDTFQYSITYYEFLNLLLYLKYLEKAKIYGIKIKKIGKMIRQLYKNKQKYTHIIASLKKRKMELSLRIKFYLRNCFDVQAISFFCSIFEKVHNVTIIMDFDICLLSKRTIKSDGTKPGNQEIEADIQKKLRTINHLLAEGKYMQLKDGFDQYLEDHVFKCRAVQIDSPILEERKSSKEFTQQTEEMKCEHLMNVLKKMGELRISFQGLAGSLVAMLPSLLSTVKNIVSIQIADFCFTQQISDSLARYINENPFKHLSIKRCQNVNLEKITKRNLVELELMFVKFVKFEQIAPQSVLSNFLLNAKQMNCLKLQSIYLQENPKLISLQYLNNIKHLIIIDCPWINDDILATISQKSIKKLESLRLVGCPQITIKSIDQTIMNLTELSGLDIGHSSICVERLLLLKTKNISRLCLENCASIDNKIMLAINKKWPTITHLNIYHCPNVTQSVLEIGFKYLQFLVIQTNKLERNLQKLRYRGVAILPNIYEVKRRLGWQPYDLI